MTDIDIVARYSYDMHHIFICHAYVNACSFFFFFKSYENLYSTIYSLLLNVYLSICCSASKIEMNFIVVLYVLSNSNILSTSYLLNIMLLKQFLLYNKIFFFLTFFLLLEFIYIYCQ